jgi:simple sugar transport system ATP-binding protein
LEYTLNAKAGGLSVIFITHNVHHVMAVADRYTIVRHGKKVGTYDREDVSFDDISDLITGARES